MVRKFAENKNHNYITLNFNRIMPFEVFSLKIVSTVSFLAQLFSKKTSRYCHSPDVIVCGDVVVWGRAKTLTFSYISVITEDIYLKFRVVVHYQKGNPYQ